MLSFASLILLGLLFSSFSGSIVAQTTITLVKRMEHNPNNWSPDSAKRFLLSEQYHLNDHSKDEKEEAYQEWMKLLNDTPAASTKQRQQIIEPSKPAETIQEKKRVKRITVHQQLFKKFIKEGLSENEAKEKAREVVAQRRKKHYDKNPKIQEKRRIKEESRKSKKDERNARRREKYATEKAALEIQNTGTIQSYRKRKPIGQGTYDKMYNYQLEKHLSHGLNKEEAEKAAKLKTEQIQAKNKQNSAKYNAKKRKADTQKDKKREK